MCACLCVGVSVCACGLLLILQKSICRGVCGISQQPTQIRPFVSFSSASCLRSCLLPHFLVSCLISLSRISSPSFGFLFCFVFLPYFLVSSIVSCLSPPMFPFSSCCLLFSLLHVSLPLLVFCLLCLSPVCFSCVIPLFNKLSDAPVAAEKHWTCTNHLAAQAKLGFQGFT